MNIRNKDICEKIFHPITGTAMDELFTRYMYYERSLQKNKSTTTEALRKFYEKNTYSLLKRVRNCYRTSRRAVSRFAMPWDSACAISCASCPSFVSLSTTRWIISRELTSC